VNYLCSKLSVCHISRIERELAKTTSSPHQKKEELIGGFEGTLRPTPSSIQVLQSKKNSDSVRNSLPSILGTDSNDDHHTIRLFEKRKGNVTKPVVSYKLF